tara:strand:- start:410 stop:2761 length:2352 start_codon:yes stop_codon:yes gene_type:complete
MVYKRTRAGSRFARDKSPLANRRTGIPLKSTVYEGQLGSASIRWILHRTKSEGWCIHCNKTIPKNSIVESNKGIGIRHEKCAKQFEESEKYKKNIFRAIRVEDIENFEKYVDLLFKTEPFNEDEMGTIASHLFDIYEYESAITYYDIILKHNPKAIYAIVSKGASYLRLEQFEKSKRCYNKVLKLNPNDIDILDRLQRLNFQMGNYKKSISLLKKLGMSSKINHNGPFETNGKIVFQDKLVETYYHIGEFENAVKANEKIRTYINSLYNPKSGFKIVDKNDGKLKNIAIKHLNAINRKRSCLISIIQNETIEKNALTKINRYLKNDPERFVKAIMFSFYLHFKKQEEANKIWHEVLKLKIKDDYDLFFVLEVYKAQKNYKKIIETCKEHFNNKNLKFHIQYTMAFAYANDKKYVESNKIIQEIFQESQKAQIPPDPELLELLAKNFEKLGDTKMTLGALETSVKFHDSTDSLRKIIKKLRKPGKIDQILPHLKKLYKMEPNNFVISIEYISGLIETKSYDDALDIIEKIEQEQKLNTDDNSILLLKKAICLFHLGNTDSAHEIATDLLTQNSKFKDALDVVALTSIKLGKRKLGLTAIEKAEKIVSQENEQNEELPSIRIPRKAERALNKTKNVVTKPTFRYNPDKKIADNRIIKTAINAVCALFNSKGGVLRIGVSNGNTIGIEQDLKLFGKKERNNDGFEEYIRKTVGQKLSESQTGKFLEITFPKIKSHIICEVNVPFSNVPMYVKSRNKDEEFYVIQNNVSTRLSPKQQIKYIKNNFEI